MSAQAHPTTFWRDMLSWLHHCRMLLQYDETGLGPFVILRSGEQVNLEFPPRRGTRTWELSDGRTVNSADIATVLDLSACGYAVRERDYHTRNRSPSTDSR